MPLLARAEAAMGATSTDIGGLSPTPPCKSGGTINNLLSVSKTVNAAADLILKA